MWSNNANILLYLPFGPTPEGNICLRYQPLADVLNQWWTRLHKVMWIYLERERKTISHRVCWHVTRESRDIWINVRFPSNKKVLFMRIMFTGNLYESWWYIYISLNVNGSYFLTLIRTTLKASIGSQVIQLFDVNSDVWRDWNRFFIELGFVVFSYL